MENILNKSGVNINAMDIKNLPALFTRAFENK